MAELKRVVAVVVAAGKSSRMGGGKNKVLSLIGKQPVLSYSLDAFQRASQVDHVVVVGRKEDEPVIKTIINDYCPKANGHFVEGGAERFESVQIGLKYFENLAPDAVLIHDAARPFLQPRFINDSLNVLETQLGCVVGVPLKDTLKEIRPDESVLCTHDRSKYWLAQTPQVFRYESILNAYQACQPPPYPTDDGEVLEMAGETVKMIEGSYLNIKITHLDDYCLAESIISLMRKSSESL